MSRLLVRLAVKLISSLLVSCTGRIGIFGGSRESVRRYAKRSTSEVDTDLQLYWSALLLCNRCIEDGTLRSMCCWKGC